MKQPISKQGLMVLAQCASCGSPVWKRFIEYVTKRRHFCNKACYVTSDAAAEIGRHAGKSVLDSATRSRIARAGGQARARLQSASALRVIALKGLATRLALPLERRSEINRLAAERGLMTRYGKFPRRSVWYALSPGLNLPCATLKRAPAAQPKHATEQAEQLSDVEGR